MDWVKVTQKTWQAVAYLARNGHQEAHFLRDWPRSDVIRLARMVEELVKAENRRSGSRRAKR